MMPSTSSSGSSGTTDSNTKNSKKRRGNAISNNNQAGVINQEADAVAARGSSDNIRRNTATGIIAPMQKNEKATSDTDRTNICNMVHTSAATLSTAIQLDAAAIDEQKKRAKQFWNNSSYNEDIKESINDDVLKHLDQGLVLPIFHTLCQSPEKRLFLPNTLVGKEDENCSDVIRLSAAPVTVGVCADENDVVGEVTRRRERSYIPAFFKSENIGNFRIKDQSFIWEFDVEYTKMVVSLVNAPSQMVGEDIEVTKLLKPFHVDVHYGTNLITRRLSRGVVADCFERSKVGSCYAITGSPGIGKSWTLIYTLQQALLYENACVLFCFQKLSCAIICIRRNNNIYVWKNQDVLWRSCCYSRIADNSNVLVLLDPKVSQKGGAEYVQWKRMLIMAASNDVNHFYSSKKSTPDLVRILSVFTENELIVALPYMVESQIYPAPIKEMLARVKIVGPIPQYIVSKENFIRREHETNMALNKLYKEEIKEFLSFNGLIKNNCVATGCLFSVNVDVREHNCEDNHCVGYDGQCILNYSNREISFMSDTIIAAIAQSSREIIHSFAAMDKYG